MIPVRENLDELEDIETVFDKPELLTRIEELKNSRGAVILAHNYQPPDIQDLADYTGDSLGLSRKAAATDSEVIVFCGVHFMAETAYILSPTKIVLLPEPDAGCPLADFATAEAVRKRREELSDVLVVSYVNTTAEVKAESDYCCTSANAVGVVSAVESDRVLFVPDQNLAAYVAGRVSKEVIPWPGFCHVHHDIQESRVAELKGIYPEAEVMAHPECRGPVLAISDHVCSTSQMLDVAVSSKAQEFIVATEKDMIYPLQRAAPEKVFHPVSDETICPDMKAISLFKVAWALESLEPRVVVPEDIRVRAFKAVERMLRVV